MDDYKVCGDCMFCTEIEIQQILSPVKRYFVCDFDRVHYGFDEGNVIDASKTACNQFKAK